MPQFSTPDPTVAPGATAVLTLAHTSAAPAVPDPAERYPALFHLGYMLPRDLAVIRAQYSTVKFVLLCGSGNRAALLARSYVELCDGQPATLAAPLVVKNLCATDRYALYQPHAAVLTASHGIGKGSSDILFHEITSLLRVAGAVGFSYIRVGSCGGCGIPAGTLVVSTKVVDDTGVPIMRSYALGKEREYPAALDQALTGKLADFARRLYGDDHVRTGVTMCCETFYQGQARMDGAFADYSVEDKAAFLERCRKSGILNFEMESLVLAAFCTRANIPVAVVCAALVDRLSGGSDTPDASPEKLTEWEHLPVRLVTRFVHHLMNSDHGRP
jgi:uridine phosphorylase